MLCTAARCTHTLGYPWHLLIPYPDPALLPVHSYPRSATAPPYTLSRSCTVASALIPSVSHSTFLYAIPILHCCQCTHTLGQPQHLLICYADPALLPVHSYPRSATAPSYMLCRSCTVASALIPSVSHSTLLYAILILHCCQCTHTLGQPQHLLIRYPDPALLPVHSYPRSATAPSYMLCRSCTVASALIPSVSHSTFLYAMPILHCCQCTHTLGQPQHPLICYPDPALLPVHSYPRSATAPSYMLCRSCTVASALIPLASHSTFTYSTSS